MNQILQILYQAKMSIESVAGIFAGSIFEGDGGIYVWEFAFITLVLGGSAARVTGRANAKIWRPYYMTVAYILLLGLAVRFLHFALFQRTLLSIHYYVVDEIFLQAIAALAFQKMRASQMTRQYRWMFDRAGSRGWVKRAQ
jgi:hypothetical protein